MIAAAARRPHQRFNNFIISSQSRGELLHVAAERQVAVAPLLDPRIGVLITLVGELTDGERLDVAVEHHRLGIVGVTDVGRIVGRSRVVGRDRRGGLVIGALAATVTDLAVVSGADRRGVDEHDQLVVAAELRNLIDLVRNLLLVVVEGLAEGEHVQAVIKSLRGEGVVRVGRAVERILIDAVRPLEDVEPVSGLCSEVAGDCPVVVVVAVGGRRLAEEREVAAASGFRRRVARRREHRVHHCRRDGDNSDDQQEFEKGEVVSHFLFPFLLLGVDIISSASPPRNRSDLLFCCRSPDCRC